MLTLNSKDIKATIKGEVVLTLKRRIGPFARRRKWLERTQWWSDKRLKRLQLTLLKRIVLYSYDSVPYYRRLMDKLAIRPEDIKDLSDIERFPIMSKADLKECGNDIVSRKFNPRFLKTAHTGGTTGLPIPLSRDLGSIGNEHAFVRRQFDWAGIGLDDRYATMMWQRVADVSTKVSRPYIYDAAMKELILSTFHICNETVEVYAKAMKGHRVKALLAYPSAAYTLAKGCLDRNMKVPLKAVLTTAETLDPLRKETISQAFCCPVYDFYGSSERVCYIHTCPQGRYHIVSEYGLTELLPAAAPNEDCFRIIATGFWNMAMPLIRYDIGDLVIKSDEICPCGRKFDVIKRIIGREADVITTPSGRTLGATAIECILAKVLYGMYSMPVAAGQVIQETSETMVLEYVPAEGFLNEHTQKLRQLLADNIPNDMKAQIRSVEKLTHTPNGKYLSFVMRQHH